MLTTCSKSLIAPSHLEFIACVKMEALLERAFSRPWRAPETYIPFCLVAFFELEVPSTAQSVLSLMMYLVRTPWRNQDSLPPLV